MAQSILSSFITAVVNTIGDEYDRIERKELDYERACRKTDEAARDYQRAASWHNIHVSNIEALEEQCRRLERMHYANPYDVGIANAYNRAYAELRRQQHEMRAERANARAAEKRYRRARKDEDTCLADYTYMEDAPERIINAWF